MFKPTRQQIETAWYEISVNPDRRAAAFAMFNLQLPYRAYVREPMADLTASKAVVIIYQPLPIVTFDLHRHILNPGNLKVWFVTCSDFGEPFVVDRGFGNVS